MEKLGIRLVALLEDLRSNHAYLNTKCWSKRGQHLESRYIHCRQRFLLYSSVNTFCNVLAPSSQKPATLLALDLCFKVLQGILSTSRHYTQKLLDLCVVVARKPTSFLKVTEDEIGQQTGSRGETWHLAKEMISKKLNRWLQVMLGQIPKPKQM